MNYRHAYHAGNFADVLKHVALVGILLHLRKKEKPFRVIDTHAGRGIYELGGNEAIRTGEAREGIARLGDLAAGKALPEALSCYLEIVQGFGPKRYPGSPLIAAQLLREKDRLIAIESQPEEEQALQQALGGFPNAKSQCADGYARLASHLPPPERRGLVLIDPPYEAQDEFTRVGETLSTACRRFATGIYLVWYPIKSPADSNALAGEVRAGGARELVRITIDVGRDPRDDKERLSSAGLLILNPPFGFAEEMRAAAGVLSSRLGRNGNANILLQSL